MIKAGAMREQIAFERKIEAVQPSGAVQVQWAHEQTMRAELVQEGAEAFLSSIERTEDRKVFRLWACAWITTDLRRVHDDRTYRIAKVLPIDRLCIELHCVNAVNEVQT
jgi:head-tail adaptor